ncbi:MAG: ABC transporter ATP-binding protein/permease [Candidatus Omnitrophica bacterium]|nr:ABC transporter ATP-binding protein/permease [Candidatus Omnitrophota bacterium]
MRVFIFIYEIFKKFSRLFTITVLLIVFVSILEAASLLTIGPLVDFLVHPDLQNISPLTQKIVKIVESFGVSLELKNYLLIFAVFIIVSSAFRIIARHAVLKTKYAVIRGLMMGTFEDFFNAQWQFFSSRKQGVFINTFIREFNIIGGAFGAMATFFASIIQLLFCLAVPFYLSWQVTMISLVTAFLLSLPFIFLGKTCYRLGGLSTSTANRMGSVIQESFSLSKIILGFGNQQKSIDSLAYDFDAHCQATLKSQTIGLAIPVLYRPLGVIVLAVALFSSRYFGIPLSEVVVLLLALLQGVIYIGDLTATKNSLDNFFPSYEQVNKLRIAAKQLKQTSGGKTFSGFDREIMVDNVSFAYLNNEAVLKNINLKITKGKMIAIVGESGAGKSTLVDMVMGFYEPMAGQITFDDISLEEFDINSYRRRIGYVPQNSILFNMTIRENLIWAKENAGEEEIKYACQLSNAAEFIESFPEKYDTVVGDRGVRLSGGQLQRIALARAILRKPDLLILDEATSSLDTHSERAIQRAVENIAKETTVIVIAHRLSTIVNADFVYVLKGGEVIEEGTYWELIKMNGHFDRMVKLQLLATV